MDSPWSISSRKKLSLPQISCHFAAASSASRSWPSRNRVWISPDGQPVVAMMPSAWVAISSSSMRGHLPSWPSIDASDDSLNRFRRPVEFSATIVMWVYAPLPETSSDFWLGSPHSTRLVLNRDSGATYASMPMIGLMPCFLAEL